MWHTLLFNILVIVLGVVATKGDVAPPSTPKQFYNTQFPNTTWDDINWRITTTRLDQGEYQSRISLANGYLGINVAAAGPFFERDIPVDGDDIEGWPLFNNRQTFATIAGFYDYQPTTNGSNFPWLDQYGGESVISGMVHFAAIGVVVNGKVLDASVDPSQISNFSSIMDFSAGVKSWDYVWTPEGETPIHVQYAMFVHKLHVNSAVVQLRLTADQSTNVTVLDILNGDSAVRTDFTDKGVERDTKTIWSAVRPNGITNVTAYVYSTLKGDEYADESTWSQVQEGDLIGYNQSSIGQSVTVRLCPRETSTVEKYVGVASSDAYEDAQGIARNTSLSSAMVGYAALLHSHSCEWAGIITRNSTDSYRYAGNGSLPDDQNLINEQIQAITSSFYLLQNTVSQNAIAAADNNQQLSINSIPVCGLGSDCYGGQIFWDAEVWMFPGLAIAHPEASKQILQYRVAKFLQAQRNVDTVFTSSQKDKAGEFDGAAVFPWTSGRYGNCTGTGPCFDYEYHINGDIGLAIIRYFLATGDTAYFKNELFPIFDGIASFYSTTLSYNKTSGMYDLYNATDPDEYANNVDNPGYTMVLIKEHLTMAIAFRERFGLPVNETWKAQIDKINVPIDQQSNLILEYTGMNGSISVKQADVVLIDDLLNYPNPYSLADLDYYAARQSQEGPGMTFSVFSIVANIFSLSGCSTYTYFLYGSTPYARGPWYQYSEQLIDDYGENGGTHPAFPFLTGMGGALQVAPFGFLGLKLMNASLYINPSLPPQIPHIEHRTIYWSGWAIKATSNQTHTTLSRVNDRLATANMSFAGSSIPVMVGGHAEIQSLSWQEPLVVQNRQYGQNKTISGNIAQCQPVSSSSAYEPGQFPLAAVDGAVSTVWQPSFANVSSSMTVQILQDTFFPVTGFRFDWGQTPPTEFSVSFSNASYRSAQAVNVASSDQIAISNSYDLVNKVAVAPYTSNTTNVTLPTPVWSGRFATLTIKGNQAGLSQQTTGATVAEWAIIASNGQVPMVYHED